MTTPTQAPLEATIPSALAGRRLDAALAEVFPGHSRSRLSNWLKEGRITVNGAPARGRDGVRGGERLVLVPDAGPVLSAAAQDIPLEILHEDAHLYVINKPAGLVVHPGAGNPDGTLVNALLHRDATLVQLPRAGIVHRLDKDTSGVMMVARTEAAQTRLVEMLGQRDIHRQYLAVVQGALVSGGTIDVPMDRHPRDRLKRAVREDGRQAITHFRLREKYRAHTLLECRLETGRTHQIRVHMQHLKHPIVGDPLYGGALKLPKGATDALTQALRGFKRQALHAEVLEFAHPVTHEPIRCKAPVPDDLHTLTLALREDTQAHDHAEPRW